MTVISKISILAATSAVAINTETGTTNAAIEKVVEMLTDMKKRGGEQVQEEKVAFAKFDTWCSTTMDEKKKNIEDSDLAMKEFAAHEEKAGTEALLAEDAEGKASAAQTQLNKELKDLKEEMSEKKAAHMEQLGELTESILACDNAIQTLNAVPEKAEAVSLLQGTSKAREQMVAQASMMRRLAIEVVGKAQKLLKGSKPVTALVAEMNRLTDPFAAAAERKSDRIMGLIKDVRTELDDKKNDATENWSNTKHTLDMKIQSTLMDLKSETKNIAMYQEQKTEAMATQGSATKNLDTETKNNNQEKKYLQTITSDCKLKTEAYEERQKSRADEMTAIGEAIDILSSDEMGAAKGHMSLLSKGKVSSFLQMSSVMRDPSSAIMFLREKASELHSDRLMQLAEAASRDPFAKVRDMIKGLVARLEQQAAAELTKKAKCDKDMEMNKVNIEEYTSKVKKLTFKIEMLETEIQEMDDSLKRLDKELIELKDEQAEAKKTRTEEKEENGKVISETKAGIAAVSQAESVLQNYYSTVSKSLVQTGAKQPEFSDEKYTGMGNGGVMGLLDVIKQDMDKLVRETTGEEDKAGSIHTGFLADSEAAIAGKTTLKQVTKEDLAAKKSDLVDAKSDLTGEGGAQPSLDTYIEEKNTVLDPMCLAQGESFEERDAKRKAEIESLTEALKMLQDMAP